MILFNFIFWFLMGGLTTLFLLNLYNKVSVHKIDEDGYYEVPMEVVDRFKYLVTKPKATMGLDTQQIIRDKMEKLRLKQPKENVDLDDLPLNGISNECKKEIREIVFKDLQTQAENKLKDFDDDIQRSRTTKN